MRISLSLSFPEELGDTCKDATRYIFPIAWKAAACRLAPPIRYLTWMCSWATVLDHVWAVLWRWAASCIADQAVTR